MELRLNMEDAMKVAEKNGIEDMDDIVEININTNTVRVKLSEDGGYEYSFFNEVDVTEYPDIVPNYQIIRINGYKNE